MKHYTTTGTQKTQVASAYCLLTFHKNPISIQISVKTEIFLLTFFFKSLKFCLFNLTKMIKLFHGHDGSREDETNIRNNNK